MHNETCKLFRASKRDGDSSPGYVYIHRRSREIERVEGEGRQQERERNRYEVRRRALRMSLRAYGELSPRVLYQLGPNRCLTIRLLELDAKITEREREQLSGAEST